MKLPVHIRFSQIIKVDHGNAANRAARQRFHYPRADAADTDYTHMRSPKPGQAGRAVKTSDTTKTAVEVNRIRYRRDRFCRR